MLLQSCYLLFLFKLFMFVCMNWSTSVSLTIPVLSSYSNCLFLCAWTEALQCHSQCQCCHVFFSLAGCSFTVYVSRSLCFHDNQGRLNLIIEQQLYCINVCLCGYLCSRSWNAVKLVAAMSMGDLVSILSSLDIGGGVFIKFNEVWLSGRWWFVPAVCCPYWHLHH